MDTQQHTEPDDLEEAERILREAGLSYPVAHGPYIRAAAAELERHGLTVTGLHHDDDDPRRGIIMLDARISPADAELFLAWADGRGWTYCPVRKRGEDGYAAEALPVHDLELPAAVAAAMLAELGQDVPGFPAQWQPPGDVCLDFVDIDDCYDYTDPHPALERALVAYVGYPGADKAWPAVADEPDGDD